MKSIAQTKEGITSKAVASTDEQYENIDDISLHMNSTRFRRRLENPSYSYRHRNAICGDHVELQLRVGLDGVCQEVGFEGQGCMISQAAASVLCEFVEGKSVADLRHFTPEKMLELLRIPLTPRRTQCGLLAFTALKTLLYSMDEGAQ